MSDRVIRYSPQAQDNNDIAQAIYETERDLLDGSWDSAKEIFDSQFIKIINVKGIRRYEKILGINVGQGDSFEYRKQIVLQKISYRPPYTRHTLDELLRTLWGDRDYVYEIIPEEFQLIIDIDTDDPASYLEFQKDLRRNIPANIELVMLIQYIHAYLKKNYTYGELATRFTYGELSKYATD